MIAPHSSRTSIEVLDRVSPSSAVQGDQYHNYIIMITLLARVLAVCKIRVLIDTAIGIHSLRG